jgi:hypothetical protein
VLLSFWSPKGGSGTSVVAAACALVLTRSTATVRAPGARLVDLAGDQPAIFGLDADPDTGVADWLTIGPEAPTEALDRLAVEAAPGLALLPRGQVARTLAPVAAAEAGAALGVALRDGPVPTLLDLGGAATPATRALLEVSDVALVVVRGCYLALRRTVRAPGLERSHGVVFVEEAGRSLQARAVGDVLDRPVLARIPIRTAVARAVDAGVLAARLPEVLARPAATLCESVGLLPDRRAA